MLWHPPIGAISRNPPSALDKPRADAREGSHLTPRMRGATRATREPSRGAFSRREVAVQDLGLGRSLHIVQRRHVVDVTTSAEVNRPRSSNDPRIRVSSLE